MSKAFENKDQPKHFHLASSVILSAHVVIDKKVDLHFWKPNWYSYDDLASFICVFNTSFSNSSGNIGIRGTGRSIENTFSSPDL